MSNAQGIQTLLEAEKEAAKIVAKARQCTNRIQRLKDARSEAAKEIEQLKATKNQEFAAFEKQFVGSNDESFSNVNRETEQRLISSNDEYKKNKQLVVDKLIVAVGNIEPKIHPNVNVNA